MELGTLKKILSSKIKKSEIKAISIILILHSLKIYTAKCNNNVVLSLLLPFGKVPR